MKKVLLGSSALALVGAVSAANAAEFEVVVGGYFEGYAAYAASAAIELSSLTDIAEFTKRGRVIAAELATVSLNQQATRRRLFAIAVSAATILLGFTLLTKG